MTRRYEGRWNCPSCATPMRASIRKCTNCAQPITSAVRFYLPPAPEAITDPKLLREAASGPGWHCDHCDSFSLASDASGAPISACANCGNARDRFDQIRERHAVTHSDKGHFEAAPEKPTRPLRIKPWYKSRGWQAVMALCLFIASCAVPIGHGESVITAKTWQRSLSLQEYRTVEESSFAPPNDARVHDREWAFRETFVHTSYESYDCGYSSDGNGYFSSATCTSTSHEYEDIYDWLYHYEVERWVDITRETTQGVDSKPYWPDLRAVGDLQRLHQPEEYYHFEISYEGRAQGQIPVNLVQWNATFTGATWEIPVNIWNTPLLTVRIE